MFKTGSGDNTANTNIALPGATDSNNTAGGQVQGDVKNSDSTKDSCGEEKLSLNEKIAQAVGNEIDKQEGKSGEDEGSTEETEETGADAIPGEVPIETIKAEHSKLTGLFKRLEEGDPAVVQRFLKAYPALAQSTNRPVETPTALTTTKNTGAAEPDPIDKFLNSTAQDAKTAFIEAISHVFQNSGFGKMFDDMQATKVDREINETLEKVPGARECLPEITEYIRKHPGVSVMDAAKVIAFDRQKDVLSKQISEDRKKAQQEAIEKKKAGSKSVHPTGKGTGDKPVIQKKKSYRDAAEQAVNLLGGAFD